MPKRKRAPKPFFNSIALNDFDKASIIIYATLSLAFLFINHSGSHSLKWNFLVLYVCSMQLFTYFFNYKALRNFRVYRVWFSFGLFHLLLYFVLRNDPEYIKTTGILLVTIVLLLLFQGLRFISLKFQGKELVVPSRDGKDVLDERANTLLDYLLLFIYMGAWLGLSIVV